MIDLTPLDVRNKRGDFKKLMRGYDPQEVDVFLEIVAERLEALTRENMALKERTSALQSQVNSQTDREQAVQAALVTAQELRADIRAQAQREAENVVKAAETEGRRLVAEAEAEARTKLRDAERQFDKLEDAIQMLDRRRGRFLKEFRQLLQREMDVVAVEEARQPMEERTIDLELGSRRSEPAPPPPAAPAPPDRAEPASPPAIGAAPPPPPSHRQDNLLLYLDADADDASR
ncbi:MAG: DivIVA domain-containing protein [Gemmatimonadales bacterium]